MWTGTGQLVSIGYFVGGQMQAKKIKEKNK